MKANADTAASRALAKRFTLLNQETSPRVLEKRIARKLPPTSDKSEIEVSGRRRHFHLGVRGSNTREKDSDYSEEPLGELWGCL
jgi:hypothetical protein